MFTSWFRMPLELCEIIKQPYYYGFNEMYTFSCTLNNFSLTLNFFFIKSSPMKNKLFLYL